MLATIDRLEKRDEANTRFGLESDLCLMILILKKLCKNRILHELLAKVSQLNDLVVSYVTTTKDSLTEIKKATTTLAAPIKPINQQLSTAKKTVKPDHRDEARKALDQAAKLK